MGYPANTIPRLYTKYTKHPKTLNYKRKAVQDQVWPNNSTIALGRTVLFSGSFVARNGIWIKQFTPCKGFGGNYNYTYSVSPALPTGITINSRTGLVSGMSTVITSPTVYTVTVTSGASTVTSTFTLEVNSLVNVPAQVLIVGGGGAGQGAYYGGCGGGGGAGGLLYTTNLNIPVQSTVTVSVGGGGAAYINGSQNSNPGSDSYISISGSPGATYTAFGGGRADANGGSSGGRTGPGGAYTAYTQTSQSPFTGYGSAGGNGSTGGSGAGSGGGGGGATAAGVNGYSTGVHQCNGWGGAGGAGLELGITGTNTYYAGGGGGGCEGPTAQAVGGAGGGGQGGSGCTGVPGGSGTANTGGGGGGYGGPGGPYGTIGPGGNGGSGVIILAVSSEYSTLQFSAGITYTLSTARAGYKVYTITQGTGTVSYPV